MNCQCPECRQKCQQVFALHYFWTLTGFGISPVSLSFQGPVCLLTSEKHVVLCKHAGLISSSLVACILFCWLVTNYVVRMFSPAVVCSSSGNLTLKIMETRSKVSSDSGCANSLTNSCVQNSPEIQLAIVLAKKGAYIYQGPSYGDEF